MLPRHARHRVLHLNSRACLVALWSVGQTATWRRVPNVHHGEIAIGQYGCLVVSMCICILVYALLSASLCVVSLRVCASASCVSMHDFVTSCMAATLGLGAHCRVRADASEGSSIVVL